MHALGEWVSNSRMKHDNHLEGLLKQRLLGPIPVPGVWCLGSGAEPKNSCGPGHRSSTECAAGTFYPLGIIHCAAMKGCLVVLTGGIPAQAETLSTGSSHG